MLTMAPSVWLSPRTETAFPPAVMGAVTGATTWVPPAVLSVPSVVLPVPLAVPPVVPGVFTMAPSVWLSPRTEMAFPPAVIGAATGASTWVPPRTLSDPSVDPATEDPVPPPDPATPVVASVLSLSPSTEIALPLAFTGALSETTPCVPDTAPSEPEVDAAPDEPPDAGAVVEASADELSPATETALPATVTGTDTVTSAWVPDAVPSLPLVLAAGAGAGAGAAVAA
jgi:hypothetical protein